MPSISFVRLLRFVIERVVLSAQVPLASSKAFEFATTDQSGATMRLCTSPKNLCSIWGPAENGSQSTLRKSNSKLFAKAD